MIALTPLTRAGVEIAQGIIVKQHYLHQRVHRMACVEGYRVELTADPWAAVILVGRPQSTRCAGWYGSVADVQSGSCPVTRWQVLNLARVFVDPKYQPGGSCYNPDSLPGFTDRKGRFRSTFASVILARLVACVGFDYLTRRPPCFLDEPYQIDWLLSYCDTRKHKGTIYRASGFELYRTAGYIQTWRIPLLPLTAAQDLIVQDASRTSRRSQAHRARRAQLAMEL